MSDSRLFTSTLSRRQLARRRSPRPARAVGRQLARRRSPRPARAVGRQLMLALLVAAICLAAFAAGHHGL